VGVTGAAVLSRFAAEVGPAGPVVAVGGRTQWEVGGPADPAAREVRAPGGVVSHQPAEMIVRVRAGTPIAELQEVLAGAGQMVPLDPEDPDRATVGGVLAVGRSGIRRLRYGPVRDTVLETVHVSAGGELVKAGAPVVKNVSGYDLCRLLVGSLGTLGLLAEVVLRVQPMPAARQWRQAHGADPFAAHARLFRPSSVLWDGETTFVLLEGHPADIAEEAGRLGPPFEETDALPRLPGGGRCSMRPGQVRRFCSARPPGTFLAEIGVGTVHLAEALDAAQAAGGGAGLDPAAARLNDELKARFDPDGRLNPGRRP
jgi:glycolate oxidase FAD binding subunit